MEKQQIKDDFVRIVNQQKRQERKTTRMAIRDTFILATGYGSALMSVFCLLAMERAETIFPAIGYFLCLGWFFLFIWVNGDELERRWDK